MNCPMTKSRWLRSHFSPVRHCVLGKDTEPTLLCINASGCLALIGCHASVSLFRDSCGYTWRSLPPPPVSINNGFNVKSFQCLDKCYVSPIHDYYFLKNVIFCSLCQSFCSRCHCCMSLLFFLSGPFVPLSQQSPCTHRRIDSFSLNLRTISG